MYGAVQTGVRERIPEVGCDTVDQSRCAGASSAISEVPCVVWNLNVHHRVPSSPPTSPVQSHMI